MSEPLPKAFGRYEVQEEIGRGMMGVVYRAVDPVLGRTVALKTVRVAFALAEGDREVYEKRFLTEARVAAAFTHPGIVVVHDVGWDGATGTPYVALEYLKGQTLAQMTEGGVRLSWREALRIAARLAEALHYAHSQGVVHRDIKPTNIMVLPTGEPKIMDFGIAKVPSAQLTAAGEFFGTPSYMSPEQVSAQAVDGRSDIFSLGSVLYLMLTGHRAFDAGTVPAILAKVAREDPPPPARVVPEIPADVDYLVSRALAKDPPQRYPDGKTFAEDIEDVLAGRDPRHRGGWRSPAGAESTLSLRSGPTSVETADLSRPAAAPAPSEDSLVLRLTDRLGSGGLVVVAALGLLALLWRLPGGGPAGGSQAPSPLPASAPSAPSSSIPSPAAEVAAPTLEPSPTPVPVVEPARLTIHLEHPFKKGTLRVFLDEKKVAEAPLEAEETRKMLFFKGRKGREAVEVEVPPGPHAVRLQARGDGGQCSGSIRATFLSRENRYLGAKVEGRPPKLTLSWSRPPA